MKVLLLGGTDFSIAIARSIFAAGIDLAGVVHVGRVVPISYSSEGMQNVRYADMAQWCTQNGVQQLQFADNRGLLDFAGQISADFLLLAGWYHHVPAKVRTFFKLGAAGLHASLLPRLRGGAPLPWAILSGAKKTGMSMFALGDEVDAGELYGQVEIEIGCRMSVTELVQAAEKSGCALVANTLPDIQAGTVVMQPQTGMPTWCLQRIPDDGRIDWNSPAERIDRLIRAVSRPYPGAFCDFEGRKVTIWKSEVAPASLEILGAPGQIARIPGYSEPIVVTGQGAIVISEAEIDGRSATAELRKSANKRFALDKFR